MNDFKTKQISPKVGQYVRFKNDFIQLKREVEFHLPNYHLLRGDFIVVEGRLLVCDRDRNGYGCKVDKAVDTPQELIEVGDLINDKTKRGTVLEINDIKRGILKTFGVELLRGNITKIWTLNSNGDYICQWEAE